MGTHDVQRRPVRTPEARPATALRPSRPFTGAAPSPPAEGALDPVSRVDRAARFGHDFSRIAARSRTSGPGEERAPDVGTEPALATQGAPAPAVAPPGAGVIQRRGKWERFKSWLGFGSEEEQERQALLPARGNEFNRHVMHDHVFHGHEAELEQNRRLADEAASSTVPEKVSIAGSVATGGLSGAGKVADVVKLAGLSGGQVVSSSTAALGGALTAAGGLVDAGVNVHDLATGGRQTGDNLETASKLGSNLGKVTANTGLALQQGSQVLGGSALSGAASAIGPAVAPAALAMGGLDMVGGGYGAYRAHQRQKALGDLAAQRDFGTQGMAEFAQEQQKTKRNVNLGRVLQGGLGVAGGATLLALGLSNPIGWGLLGAAGLAAGVGAGYKQYRKYKEGKRILHDDQYRARLGLSGVETPEHGKFDRQFAPKRWWNTIKATDEVRGQIAHQLVDEWPHDTPEKETLRKNIGVKEWSVEQSNRPTGEQKKKRARQIARALDV